MIIAVDHDDLLAPFALFEVAKSIGQTPDVDLLYSDEDYVAADDLRGSAAHRRGPPHFKPDWNPDLLRSTNYITHFCVARRSVIESVGGFREGFEGSQDYDLALRISEEAIRPAEGAETSAVIELCERDGEFVSVVDVDRVLELRAD